MKHSSAIVIPVSARRSESTLTGKIVMARSFSSRARRQCVVSGARAMQRATISSRRARVVLLNGFERRRRRSESRLPHEPQGRHFDIFIEGNRDKEKQAFVVPIPPLAGGTSSASQSVVCYLKTTCEQNLREFEQTSRRTDMACV